MESECLFSIGFRERLKSRNLLSLVFYHKIDFKEMAYQTFLLIQECYQCGPWKPEIILQ